VTLGVFDILKTVNLKHITRQWTFWRQWWSLDGQHSKKAWVSWYHTVKLIWILQLLSS